MGSDEEEEILSIEPGKGRERLLRDILSSPMRYDTNQEAVRRIDQECITAQASDPPSPCAANVKHSDDKSSGENPESGAKVKLPKISLRGTSGVPSAMTCEVQSGVRESNRDSR